MNKQESLDAIAEIKSLLSKIKSDGDFDIVRPIPEIIVQLGNGSVIVTAKQDTRVISRDANGLAVYVENGDKNKFYSTLNGFDEYIEYLENSVNLTVV